MPQFSYRARNYDGGLVVGNAEAPDKEALEESLGSQGLIPISVNEIRKSLGSKSIRFSMERVSPGDLIIFTRQMGTMYKAGIPFVRLIKSVGEQTENESLRGILEDIGGRVEGGETFSSALSKHPKVFDELYISMVEAGEAGGVLDEILERLSVLLEKDTEIRSKIRSATLYPKIVIGAIITAVAILVSFVIPKFAVLYGKFGASLPLPTRMLLLISGFFSQYWPLFIVSGIFAYLSFRIFIKSAAGRHLWDKTRIKIPVFGPLVLKASMSRFAMILGTLLKSGLPILMAMEISSRAIGNIILSDEVEKIREEIRGGKTIAEPMESGGLFPPMMVQMTAVGEETGKLDDMLIKVSDHMNSEVDYTIRNLSTLLEPILLSIIFGMVLFLALALFLPMWDMVNLAR